MAAALDVPRDAHSLVRVDFSGRASAWTREGSKAVRHVLLTLAVFFCLVASASAQTITIVNHTHIPRGMINRIVNAGVREANRPLRYWWHTPHVTVGQGGWVITFRRFMADCGNCDGYHSTDASNRPFAHVFTYGRYWTTISTTFSHELDEMLVDPYITHYWPRRPTRLVEVCDPVEFSEFAYDHAYVSDFVTPHWGGWRHGPYDWRRLLHRAWQVY